MRVRDIMTTPAVVIDPEMKLRDVARILIEGGISGAPVVTLDGELVGMVTEADLIALELERTVRKARGDAVPIDREWVASDVMTHHVLSVEDEDPISEVAGLMVNHGIRRVPVLRHGDVVGIVSRRDVIGTLTRSDEEIAAT
jgi:CBS domain-containing protein